MRVINHITFLVVLLNPSKKFVATGRKCDKSKCASNFCYAVGPLESCLCEDGYEAVVEREAPIGYPFLFDGVSYTCCENKNEVTNKESYQCGNSLIAMTNDIPDGFEDCTWDECNANTKNVFNRHHKNASKCVALPGEQCHCSNGYLAQRTGKSIPMHDLLENGQVVHAHQFICCPVPPVTRFGASLSPESFRPEAKFDGPTCAIPDCDDKCTSSDVCFQELGCYSPEDPEEYEGCVSDKCYSNWGVWTPLGLGQAYTDFGLSCWAGLGIGCYCEDGLVAKTTGRVSNYTGAVEYVCCPEGTPGAEGLECNKSPLLGILWLIAFVLIFPLLFVFCKKCLRNKKQNNNYTGVTSRNAGSSKIGDFESGGASVLARLEMLEKDLLCLREEMTDKLREQEVLMKSFRELKSELREQGGWEKKHGKDFGYDSSVEETIVEEASLNGSNENTQRAERNGEIAASRALSRRMGFFDFSSGSDPTGGGGEFEGIHQYLLHHITDLPWDNTNSFNNLGLCCSVCMTPILSWIFLLLPLYILLMIIVESQFPKCLFGCERSGETCSGSPDDDESFCYGTGVVCSYLKHTTKPTPWSTIITCAFAFLYVLSGSINDMAQNHRATKAANHRFKMRKSNSTLINSWIRFNIWAINIVRGYLIPAATFASTIAILHSATDSLKISNILLNGVAIIVIGDIDDAMGYFFVSSKTQNKVSDEMEAALAAWYDEMGDEKLAESCRYNTWVTDRIMSLMMYAASVPIATCPLDAMLYLFGKTSCENFIPVVCVTVYIGLGFAVIDSSLHGASPSWTFILFEYFMNLIFMSGFALVSMGLSVQRTTGHFSIF